MKLIYHPAMLEHQVDEACPEKPERIESLVDNVPAIADGLERRLNGQYDELVLTAPYGEQYLDLVHTPKYIRHVKELCESLGDTEITSFEQHPRDVCFSRQTYKAACYAVGGAVQAAILAKRGQKSFALVRPPGHHASAEQESGFCIFNNVAIATEYLRRKGERVMIVDIDLHLGDGTLAYIEGKENIFYFSINQENTWPHLVPEPTGNSENIFLPEGTDDEKYRAVLWERLVPALDAFNPSIVAVSAGFDTHGMDAQHFGEELEGGFILSHQSYKELWEILDKKMIPYFAVLEGGYNPLSVMAGVLSFLDKDKA